MGVKQGGSALGDEATAAPILPSRDFERSAEFYERLGFTVASIYQPPDAYLILRKRDLALHFFPHFDLDPTSSYAGCYIRVADVDAWYECARNAGLGPAGIPRLVALSDRPWGMREFAIIDPDGSLLRIGTPSR